MREHGHKVNKEVKTPQRVVRWGHSRDEYGYSLNLVSLQVSLLALSLFFMTVEYELHTRR